MYKKSTDPSGRAIYPSRLIPTPSTTFLMAAYLRFRIDAFFNSHVDPMPEGCIIFAVRGATAALVPAQNHHGQTHIPQSRLRFHRRSSCFAAPRLGLRRQTQELGGQ